MANEINTKKTAKKYFFKAFDLDFKCHLTPFSDNGYTTFKIKRGKTISQDNRDKNKKSTLTFKLFNPCDL